MASTSVINQALLSAASLAAGLILIRFASNADYAYYVLVINLLALMASLQGSFIGPTLGVRLVHAEPSERIDLVGGIYRDQRRVTFILSAALLMLTTGLWITGYMADASALICLAGSVILVFSLHREYFRMVLLGFHRTTDVLKADAAYAIALVSILAMLVMTPYAAVASVMGLGIAAAVGGWRMRMALYRHERWNEYGMPGILRQIAPVNAWVAVGAIIHWSFSQGYSYIVAGTLGLESVAAIAATRMLLMPVNLLSTGLGSMMLPLTSRWLKSHGPSYVFRRLVQISAGLAALSAIYSIVIYLLQDWIMGTILRKQFEDSHLLILLWSIAVTLVVCRDPMIHLLMARSRFRTLTALTAVSATVAVAGIFIGMRQFGVPGSVIGIIAGECVQVAGIMALAFRESRRP